MEKRLKRRLSVEEAMFVWPQVVDAVNYLHSLPEPVIHKDIKGKLRSCGVAHSWVLVV